MNRRQLLAHRFDYCNGRLDAETRRRVDEALLQAPELARDFAELAEEIRAFRSLSAPGAVDDAVGRIRQSAAVASTAAIASLAAGARPAPNRRPWMLAASGAALVLILAWLSMRPAQESLAIVDPTKPRVQMALSRQDGAVRLFLVLPNRDAS